MMIDVPEITDEEWSKIQETLEEKMTYARCAELLEAIVDETPNNEELSPLDKVLWAVRWAYIIGQKEALTHLFTIAKETALAT